MTSTPGVKKGNSFVRALVDLLILALLLVGAGFGGYFWGTHQQLAPVAKVPPGTVGAIPPPITQAANASAVKTSATGSSESGSSQTHSKKKYWICSSGADYIGYSITAKVNETPVDSFFGPGKSVDITPLVKPGSNTVVMEAKEMGDQYNKHTGDASAILVLDVVSGPHITDSFKSSAVVLSYKKNAAQTEDASETFTFNGD